MKAPEQTLRLAETSNMLRRIAAVEIAHKGEYLCMVDGKRTRVIADEATR